MSKPLHTELAKQLLCLPLLFILTLATTILAAAFFPVLLVLLITIIVISMLIGTFIAALYHGFKHCHACMGSEDPPAPISDDSEVHQASHSVMRDSGAMENKSEDLQTNESEGLNHHFNLELDKLFGWLIPSLNQNHALHPLPESLEPPADRREL